MEQNNMNELYHYGVLGMKWGKRKARQYEYKANRLDSRIARKKEKGKLLTVRDANNAALAANLKSKANDLKSDKKVTSRERRKNANIARTNAVKDAKNYNKQLRIDRNPTKHQKKVERYEKMVKDNDRRVEKYGKHAVKIGNTMKIAGTAYGMSVGLKVIEKIGKSSMKGIAKNPNLGNGALHAASILTVAGMGAYSMAHIKRIKRLSADKRLADQYEQRQYMYKQIKNKK